MDATKLALLALASGACCAALVPLVRRLALALGAVDQPGGRRVHREPTARLGGVAIFGAFVVLVGIASIVGREVPGAASYNPHGALAFALGATLVFATGVIDDLRRLEPGTKLLVEVVAAGVVVFFGDCGVPGISAPGGELSLGPLAAPLTILWIVTVTNAVNLTDGLDGLAAGLAAIAFGAILAIAFPDHASAAVLAAILVGACLGFLLFNFHPASIFMGDSGSLFLGFALGVLSTYARAKSATGALTIGTLLIVGLPLGDTLWAVARRYLRGLVPTSLRSHFAGVGRILLPDRNHIHHRLLRAGLGQRQATFALYAIQVVACGGAVYLVVSWS